jgi:glutamate--glyoxylate aminotransferase
VPLQVYQENIYQDERPFVAARKVMKEMGEPYASGVELLSFHTVSKVSQGRVVIACLSLCAGTCVV